MADIPLGFSVEVTASGFVLRNKTADGNVTEMVIPLEQITSLRAEIDLWMDRRWSVLQTTEGAQTPVQTLWIAEAGVWPGTLGEHVILIATGQSGGRIALQFPLAVADLLAADMVDLVSKMKARSPTKQ